MSSSWVVDVDYPEPQAKVERLWVVDMEKKLDDAEQPDKVERWPRHCIFRVPLRFKMVDGSVYKPRTVSLGPFHHDDVDLKPMEMHKLRAVRHLVRRDSCKTTLAELVAAVDEVADELEDSYMDLGDEWRGQKNRGKFLEMMISDGCFLLEVMRAAAGKQSILKDYAHGDPVFSWDGIQQIKPFVQRDMLMVENQLPLRLLERIVAAEDGTSPSTASINSMVLKFLEGEDATKGTGLGLHPLVIYRTSRLKGTSQIKSNITVLHRGMPTTPTAMELSVVRPERVVPRSAWTLYKAGIQFLPSKTSYLDDIQLDNGRLYMPRVLLDDSTVYRVLNMMAFEAIHVGTRDDVTAYVFFVKDFVDSAHDVRLLVRKRILEHHLPDDAAVVSLFNRLTRDVSPNWGSQLWLMQGVVERHYRSNYLKNDMRFFLYEAWANLRSPWTLLGLLTATLLLVADIVQAVYAVKSYYEPDKGN